MTYGSTDVSQLIDDDDEDINIVIGNPDRRNRHFNRKSSVILPTTGERVHRQLNFADTSYETFDDPNDTDELLGRDVANMTGNTTIDTYQSETSPLLLSSNVSWMNKAKILMYVVYNYWITAYHTDQFKSILKCSIAYLIGSLGVYWGPFNRLMGNSDFKHVISTVVVYFHPSRTKGSMHITLVYVIVSIVFSFSVSFGCRFLSAAFYNSGNEEVSYGIDLVISSVSLGIVAFMKQKVNKETFNTACSLASISIVACVIKEGSLNGAIIPIGRLESTLKIVLVGCFISVSICYLLWPKSAEDILVSELSETYNTMSSLLSVLANRFLQGEKLNGLDNEIFNKLSTKTKNLEKNLEEAKYEMYLKGNEVQWSHLRKLVDITIGLTQHLKALRSSTEMQWKLLHESDEESEEIREISPTLRSLVSDLAVSDSIENLTKINIHEQDTSADVDYIAINSSQMFDLFVYYLAPSTKAFIFTIKNILNDLPTDEQHQKTFIKTVKYQKSLKIALKLFDDKQIHSFKKLYDQERFKSNTDFLFKSDLEEVTACCGNFSGLLKYFGEELLEFLQLLDEKPGTEKSWKWTKWWKKNEERSNSGGTSKYNSNLNDALFYLQNQYNLKSVDKDNVNIDNSTVNYYSYKLWQVLKIFKRTDIQFGIRVGLGAFMLSLFAFYPKTKSAFNNWRGEWSLTIYCIMMNKSLGGTQMTVKWRFLGTFLGALVAWIVWLLFDGHPLALGVAGFVLSVPCFYIIIYWKKNNPFGRFILLTYNLTALYSYTMEDHDSEDDNEGGESPIISEIAFHRFISVSIGVIWALTMASIFMPNSARSRLKSGLTILWLRIGVIWNSDPLDYTLDEEDQKHKLISLKGGENSLNHILSELEVLIKQAPLEFRIKGKFPQKKYESLIKSTSKIIDALHNMILMIEVDPILSANEEFVINYIENERHELEHRIFLIFYMIASSMKLQFPLPSKPASTEHAKDRLLYKLSQVRSNTMSDTVMLSNEDYVLLYSYILVTNIITQELDKIIEVIKELMGDISEDIFQLV